MHAAGVFLDKHRNILIGAPAKVQQ